MAISDNWGKAHINNTISFGGGVSCGDSFDTDYQAVLDYATTQGYTLPSAGQQTLQNQVVLDLKAAGVWGKLDMFGIRATDGDVNFSLINWMTLSTHTAVNSPLFTINTGFTGDGTSSYIITDFTPYSSTKYAQDDAMYGVWFSGTFTQTASGFLGSRDATIARAYAYSTAAYMVNTSSFSTGTVNSTQGYRAFQRENSTQQQRWVSGVLDETLNVNSISDSVPVFYSLGNNDSGSLLFPSSNTEQVIFAGQSLSAAEHLAFNNALSNYLTTI